MSFRVPYYRSAIIYPKATGSKGMSFRVPYYPQSIFKAFSIWSKGMSFRVPYYLAYQFINNVFKRQSNKTLPKRVTMYQLNVHSIESS